MVSCVEMKIQMVFFAKKKRGLLSIHCEVPENKRYVSVT